MKLGYISSEHFYTTRHLFHLFQLAFCDEHLLDLTKNDT